jgi:iron complex outermembrane recepter protein
MKNLAILVFLFALSITAFAQNNGKISGKVIFGNNDSPLHEALVKIVQLNRSVETEEDGSYEFNNIPAGKYTIIAHQDGFGDATKTIVFVNGAVSVIDFTLNLIGVKEQVTVTAAGTEQTAFDSLQSVSIVDSNKILERAGVGLGDVLDKESGVTKRTFGAGNSRPVIRGFDGDRVLVSNDGVRTSSLGSTSGDHGETVDTLSVERIEVVKGPATLLYGSNAIGGVVNAISGHDEGFHSGTRGYFSTLGGTNSKQSGVSGGIETGYKNFMFWGNGSGQRTNDYKAGKDFGRNENSFTRSAGGNAGGGYFKNKFFATANYRYYQSRFGIPLDFREEDPELRSLKVKNNDYRFNGGFRDLNSFITGAKFTVNYTDYKHEEIAGVDVGTTFRNKVLSYRGVFDQKRYNGLMGRFGFEGYQRKYNTVGSETLVVGLVKQNSFAAFALQEYSFNRVTLQFGGRIENNRFRPENLLNPNRDFTAFSGAIGARVALWEGGAFVANYTNSTRTPQLEELYNNGPHDGTLFFEVGNINLRKERSNGLDLSLRHQKNRFRAEFNAFYYDIKNFVFLAPTGEFDEESGFEIAEFSQGDTRYYGNEFNLDITANKYLSFTSGLDYVNAKLKSGTPLPRIPPFRARLGFDAHYGDFSVRPEVVLVNRQGRTFTNETPTAGYGIFNIAANYILPGKHFANIFSVNGYNLTDKLYFNHISAIKDISPEIGRGVRFSYTIRFF